MTYSELWLANQIEKARSYILVIEQVSSHWAQLWDLLIDPHILPHQQQFVMPIAGENADPHL